MQKITLTQEQFKIPPTVHMVQNDERTLKMVIADIIYEDGDVGTLYFKRSDGSYYSVQAELNESDNSYTAVVTQALTQAGITECQLKVDSSVGYISTYTFYIDVQESVNSVDDVVEQMGVTAQELAEAAQQLTLSDNDVKLALLQIAEKVAYTDEHGQDYYDALENALYPPIRATSVSLNKASLVFSGIGGTDTLVAIVSPNNVEDDTVYWGSSDKDVAVVADGVVIATGIGNCTITAICNTKSASASVAVAQATLLSISAVYTQSGTVYEITPLDDLKDDLVVTAYWSDNTQSTVPSEDYTLSGTLEIGSSTITVTYSTETTTFNVTVSDIIPEGYTRVQYLHSSANAAGTQSYINTGITFSNPTFAKFHVIFSEDSDATSAGYAIGVRQTGTGNSNNIGWGVRIIDHTKVGSWSGSPGADAIVEAASMVDATATWQSGKVTIQVGSGDVITSSQTVRSITAGYPICLFGLKHTMQASGGSPYPIKGNIYYAKAEQDGTVLFECYPVVRDSDSKPGFYDIKNNAFYAPYGNYITAGPES